MNTGKYSFVIILVSIAFFMLASCSGDEPRYKIGVSQCSDDEWRSQLNREMLREANFYDGVEVDIRSAHDDSNQQIEDIKRLVADGIDLLIVAPNEAVPMTPVVEEVYGQGIPVIVMDRQTASDKYTAFVGADNYVIGKTAGNYIANMLGERGNIVEITGLSGSTPAGDRHRGFADAIASYPDMKLLAVEDGAYLQDKAEMKMDSLLSVYPSVDVVFAHNDRMALGAYEAAERASRQNEIKFVGVDALFGSNYGIESVLDGKLAATIIYPTEGEKVVDIAMSILEGRGFPKETILKTSVVDKDKAPIMKMQREQILSLDEKIETLNGRVNVYLARNSTQSAVIFVISGLLLLVVVLLIMVYVSLRTKNRLNKELHRQKSVLEEQKEQLMQSNELLSLQKSQLEHMAGELESATHAKLVFFTNVSHDFRTPLTLIADPIEHLLADKSISLEQHELLLLIRKNVRILLRLVNEILDFRKVENGRMELNLSAMNLVQAFTEWNKSFTLAMRKKHISFSFDAAPADGDFQQVADVEKMERIYFNLFSNAVKYTPEKGEIKVKLEAGDKDFTVSIFNSGSHIKVEEVNQIFERFYKLDRRKPGTGIGLALVKAFVELHGGTVCASSDEDGTTFRYTLPRRSEQNLLPEDEEHDNHEKHVMDVDDDIDSIVVDDRKNVDLPVVLVVDDNSDIRTYEKSILSKDFNVLAAKNGEEGIKLATKYVPDAIVLDVMMPGMDGIECCRRLKGESPTSHIPVILLTACSLDEERIQGYDGGADSYISKPFNSQLLVSRLHNLISNRRQLKQAFGYSFIVDKENIGDVDKDFMTRFHKLIKEKMQDPDLNVESIGREMGLSRVQLYRKLKSLTNSSPNELLRRIRLERASALLASGSLTVSEISYEVGFSSPSYFAKCYKEQYGESPTDFLRRKGMKV